MKRKRQIQQHPNQEDKTGKAPYASATSLNSSTTSEKPEATDMPEGAETDFKTDLQKTNKKRTRIQKTPKQ
jgi:hypothetical protein